MLAEAAVHRISKCPHCPTSYSVLKRTFDFAKPNSVSTLPHNALMRQWAIWLMKYDVFRQPYGLPIYLLLSAFIQSEGKCASSWLCRNSTDISQTLEWLLGICSIKTTTGETVASFKRGGLEIIILSAPTNEYFMATHTRWYRMHLESFWYESFGHDVIEPLELIWYDVTEFMSTVFNFRSLRKAAKVSVVSELRSWPWQQLRRIFKWNHGRRDMLWDRLAFWCLDDLMGSASAIAWNPCCEILDDVQQHCNNYHCLTLRSSEDIHAILCCSSGSSSGITLRRRVAATAGRVRWFSFHCFLAKNNSRLLKIIKIVINHAIVDKVYHFLLSFNKMSDTREKLGDRKRHSVHNCCNLVPSRTQRSWS